MPPNAAKELLPERPFRSAWCWFTMSRIPKIEKPSDMLSRLPRVEINCRVWLVVFLIRGTLNLGSPVKLLRPCVDNRKWNERPIAYPLAITHRSFGFIVLNDPSDCTSLSKADA